MLGTAQEEEEEGDIALTPLRRRTVVIRPRLTRWVTVIIQPRLQRVGTLPPPRPPLLRMRIAGMAARRLLLLRLLLLLRRGATMGMGRRRVITLQGGKEGRVGMRRIGGSMRTRDGWRGVIGRIRGGGGREG